MVESGDSLEFFAKYKDWVAINKMVVTEKTTQMNVAEYLSKVRHSVDRKAFEIIGIDVDALDSYARKLTDGLAVNSQDLISAYKGLGGADGKEQIQSAARGTEELKPFAQAYLLRSILKSLDVDFSMEAGKHAALGLVLSPEERRQQNKRYAVQGQSRSGDPEAVYFLAKYKDWVCIKKMNISAKTHPAEVAAHLASIRIAVDRKATQILGVDTDSLTAYAEKATKGMRRSAANFAKLFELMDNPSSKQAISSAAKGDKKIEEIAKIYLFSEMAENAKFDFEMNQETVGTMYPALKIPKRRGRMPGQKKKKQ